MCFLKETDSLDLNFCCSAAKFMCNILCHCNFPWNIWFEVEPPLKQNTQNRKRAPQTPSLFTRTPWDVESWSQRKVLSTGWSKGSARITWPHLESLRTTTSPQVQPNQFVNQEKEKYIKFWKETIQKQSESKWYLAPNREYALADYLSAVKSVRLKESWRCSDSVSAVCRNGSPQK